MLGLGAHSKWLLLGHVLLAFDAVRPHLLPRGAQLQAHTTAHVRPPQGVTLGYHDESYNIVPPHICGWERRFLGYGSYYPDLRPIQIDWTNKLPKWNHVDFNQFSNNEWYYMLSEVFYQLELALHTISLTYVFCESGTSMAACVQ